MSLRRKATIIGSANVPGQVKLPGVNIDMQNMRDYLMSDVGGAWREDEIEILKKPVFIDSYQAPRPPVDFHLFFFAGHGFMRNGDTYMVMNQHQNIPVSQVSRNAPRALFIIDACREVVPALRVKQPVKVASTSFGSIAGIGAHIRSRNTYDYALRQSPTGLAIMYGCAYNELAGDSMTMGGLFTHHLIGAANHWAQRDGDPSLHSPQWLNLFGVIRSAAPVVNRASRASDGEPQNPQLRCEPGTHSFPFAVLV